VAHFGLGVGDEVAGEVDGDRVQGAGERERGVIFGEHGCAGVGAAGQAARVEDDRGGDRDVGLCAQMVVDVQLCPARVPLPWAMSGSPVGSNSKRSSWRPAGTVSLEVRW
jgi:hypothetical protein